MARSKLPPVKRESSSEYFNKNTASWEDTNGKAKRAKSATNGQATEAQPAPEAVDHDKDAGAGVVQLVIAVAGIYASL